MSKTPTCLEGAGMLGHLWVVTRVHATVESILGQASYGADAVRMLDEHQPFEQRGEIYELVGRIKRSGRMVWRKRTRGYALLDQPTDGRPPYEPDMEEAQS